VKIRFHNTLIIRC